MIQIQPLSKRANCPQTEFTNDIVVLSKIRMKFSFSGRPITWSRITTIQAHKKQYTIFTDGAYCLYLFCTHNLQILSTKHEISNNRSSECNRGDPMKSVG